MRINDTWTILIGSAAVRIVARGFLLAQRLGCESVVVGGFLIRTAVKIVTSCAVFSATVHSLLGGAV